VFTPIELIPPPPEKEIRTPPPVRVVEPYVAPPVVIERPARLATPLMELVAAAAPPAPTATATASSANYLGLSPGITYAGDTPLYASYNPTENADRWSFYPARQDVDMSNYSINNVNNITASLGIFETLNTSSFTCFGDATFNASTIVNRALTFKDGASNDTLEAINGDLFFNTELLARAGDIQQIADWSLYPALSTVHMQNELIEGSSGGYIDLLNSSWNTKTPNATLLLNPGNYVQIGEDDAPNSSLFVNNIAGIGLANGTVGQFLSHNANTIEWVAAPTAANWSQYPAISTINADNNDITGVQKINGIAYPPAPTMWAQYPATSTINADNNDIIGVLKINGIAYPPPASGVASVNGQTGAVTITGDVSTITATLIGSDTQLGAPTLGTSGDLYPVQGTAWGKANYASASAASAALAAGGAATAAATAQASADAAAITAASALASATTALAQSGITSVNGGSFAATIAAGSGIGVNTTFSSGTTNPTVTISATGTAGVTTLNTLSGALTLAAGTNTSIVPSGGNTLTINSTGGGGVTTLNTRAGALTIDAGVGMSVSTGTSSITLSQTGITSLNSGNLDATILAGTGIGISTSYSSGSNNPTLVITNTGGGGGSVAYVASYNIFVAPNGSDVTGNGSANNPYLTIARALTARGLISNTIEVAIQLFAGTYAPASLSIVVPQNTYLIGIPTGEVNQPVNINAQVDLQAGTGQVTLYGLNLFPASSQCVIINAAGTYNINNCNFVNTGNYCLFQSLGTCYLTECRMTCYTGVGALAGIGGSGTTANLIMRDCVLTSAGVSPIIQYTGNLTMRQCTLTNTNTTASVNPLVLLNPTLASTTCEISLSQLIYTSATSAANKMCIRVTPSATFNVALVNTVNNLLICEGATSGAPQTHCIQNTGAGTCSLFYGNLLAGATAHNIGSGITKTQYTTVP